MGKVHSPSFDASGAVSGSSYDVRDTRRPEDVQTLKRLAQIDDPGGSGAVFQARLDAMDSGRPGVKADLGFKA